MCFDSFEAIFSLTCFKVTYFPCKLLIFSITWSIAGGPSSGGSWGGFVLDDTDIDSFGGDTANGLKVFGCGAVGFWPWSHGWTCGVCWECLESGGVWWIVGLG